MVKELELLRGQGPDLGPCALAHPFEERTMLHVLAKRADECPADPWLVFDERTLTFGDAQDLVHRVGHAVLDSVPAGAHVGLLLRNRAEFVPALYGAFSAHSVAVAFNAEARGANLHQMLADAKVELLVTEPEMLGLLGELPDLAGLGLIVVCGEQEPPPQLAGVPCTSWESWLEGRPAERPRELPRSWDTATIQFTSGTTGRAKGAVYPHHFFYLYSATQADSQGRRADDVLSTPLPLYHAAALHHVAGAAAHVGAVAHLQAKFSASRFWPRIAADGATFTIILGTMAQIMEKTVEEVPPHRLRQLFCVPPPADLGAFEAKFRVPVLWQGYGMTEISAIPMPARMETGVGPDTIGHPAAWLDYGVVDEHDRMRGVDEVGQLVFRPLLPNAMTSGYFERAEATVEAFRNGVFHTGDLASVDADGRLHFHGRGSDRIRVAGENVSPSEVEESACQDPAVVEAAAYAVPGEFGEDEIKLDVRGGDGLDLAALHRSLGARLPRFMVPRYLEQRADFPRTGSAKIEKFKLAAEGVDRPGVREFSRVTRRPSGAGSTPPRPSP